MVPDHGPGSQTHNFDSLMTNVWVKRLKIIYNFMIFVTTKNGRKKSFPSFGAAVGSGFRDPGSGVDENQYPGS